MKTQVQVRAEIQALEGQLDFAPHISEIIEVDAPQPKSVSQHPNFLRINNALKEFRKKTSSIDVVKNQNAYHAVTSFIIKLDSNLKMLNTKSITQVHEFLIDVNNEINDLKPKLENILEWGEYLNNFLKTIVNAVINFFTFGYKNNFFHLTETQELIALKHLQAKLNSERELMEKVIEQQLQANPPIF